MKKNLYQIIVLAGIALLLFIPNQAAGKKLSKYYTSFHQDIGIIYHIPSIEPFSAKKPGKELQYDITYLSSKDSMTINISYLSKELLSPDSIFLTGKDLFVAASLEKIYIDSPKSVWVCRYGFSIKYEDAQKFFELKESPSISIKDKNGKSYPCSISQGKWEKSANIINQIIYIIEMNRENGT